MFDLVNFALAVGGFVLGLVTTRIFKTESSKSIKVYKESKESDSDFLCDLEKCQTATFVGTTHPKLHNYVHSAISRSKTITEINVLYASNTELRILGKSPLEINYSIQSIIDSLTAVSFKNTNSDNLLVNISQLQQYTSFSGCFIDDKILYITHFSPKNGKFGTDGLTIRITKSFSTPRISSLYDEYSKIYYDLINTANIMTRAYPTEWDMSVEEWEEFESDGSTYDKSMNDFAAKVVEKGGTKILELGSGTGKLAEKILQKSNKLEHIMLTDFSGKMLEYCKRKFNEDKRVSIQFFNPYESGKIIDGLYSVGHRFSCVISHLSFPFPEDSRSEYLCLINMVNNLLVDNGRFIICIHNVVIDLQEDAYDRSKDNLVQDLEGLFSAKYGRKCLKRLGRTKYCQDDFKEIHTLNDFMLEEDGTVNSYHFSMKDRINMWQVPAILNTMIDSQYLGDKRINNAIFSELREKYDNMPTANVTTMTYVFRKSPAV